MRKVERNDLIYQRDLHYLLLHHFHLNHLLAIAKMSDSQDRTVRHYHLLKRTLRSILMIPQMLPRLLLLLHRQRLRCHLQTSKFQVEALHLPIHQVKQEEIALPLHPARSVMVTAAPPETESTSRQLHHHHWRPHHPLLQLCPNLMDSACLRHHLRLRLCQL